jgi:hypothetical protein
MSTKDDLFSAVGIAGLASLTVLAVVGRRTYQRKVVQLTKELAKEGKTIDPSSPPKVWAVLTPEETLKVFFVPLAVVATGSAVTGFGLKQFYGIRDLQHGIDTLKWIARVGPPPA